MKLQLNSHNEFNFEFNKNKKKAKQKRTERNRIKEETRKYVRSKCNIFIKMNRSVNVRLRYYSCNEKKINQTKEMITLNALI